MKVQICILLSFIIFINTQNGVNINLISIINNKCVIKNEKYYYNFDFKISLADGELTKEDHLTLYFYNFDELEFQEALCTLDLSDKTKLDCEMNLEERVNNEYYLYFSREYTFLDNYPNDGHYNYYTKSDSYLYFKGIKCPETKIEITINSINKNLQCDSENYDIAGIILQTDDIIIKNDDNLPFEDDEIKLNWNYVKSDTINGVFTSRCWIINKTIFQCFIALNNINVTSEFRVTPENDHVNSTKNNYYIKFNNIANINLILCKQGEKSLLCSDQIPSQKYSYAIDWKYEENDYREITIYFQKPVSIAPSIIFYKENDNNPIIIKNCYFANGLKRLVNCILYKKDFPGSKSEFYVLYNGYYLSCGELSRQSGDFQLIVSKTNFINYKLNILFLILIYLL